MSRAARGTLWTIGVFAGAGLGYILFTGQAQDVLSWVITSLQDLGTMGMPIAVVIYALGLVLVTPTLVLTTSAGFLYGPGWGLAVAVAGSNLGASVAFWLGRTLLRHRLGAWLHDRPRFRALDQAFGQGGYKLATFLRFSPLFPYNITNYALGITGMPYRHYVVGSAIGMFPITLLSVTVGASIGEVGELYSGTSARSSWDLILLGVGLFATIIVTRWVSQAASRALDEHMDTP
jgi:uncharacterized membrane protein YdjX (TVP38/TMEM64 family)